MATTLFTIHADFGRYWVKLNAEHVAEYESLLEDAPEALRASLESDQWLCAKHDDPSRCNPNCRGGIRYTLYGKEHTPCRMGAFSLPVGDRRERDFALRWIDTELATIG